MKIPTNLFRACSSPRGGMFRWFGLRVSQGVYTISTFKTNIMTADHQTSPNFQGYIYNYTYIRTHTRIYMYIYMYMHMYIYIQRGVRAVPIFKGEWWENTGFSDGFPLNVQTKPNHVDDIWLLIPSPPKSPDHACPQLDVLKELSSIMGYHLMIARSLGGSVSSLVLALDSFLWRAMEWWVTLNSWG